ncbi:MAG: hypothetical protein K2X47_17615 [Bdellovibrionales bacterium]|nr:hypothetical protein [Bdellovibrionales bacterium]
MRLVLGFLLFFCSFSASASGDVGRLKGYVAFEELVKTRLLKAAAPFSLGPYVGQTAPSGGAVDLLGSFDSTAGNLSIRSTSPNSLNMMLWLVVARSLAQDLELSCESRGQLFAQLKPSVIEALGPLCTWTSASLTEEALVQIWNQWMGPQVPLIQRTRWIEYVQQKVIGARLERVLGFRAMWVPLFLSPYVLLHD